MYYVTMTDTFMSGWGRAEGLINKLVFECDTYEMAEKVERYARTRNEMKYINITSKMPSYSPSRYLVQIKTQEDSPIWYK